MLKSLPFDHSFIEEIAKKYPTPFYIYDEAGINNTADRLYKAFAWNKGFKNYFAVKALPNPSILMLLYKKGMKLDCSSLTELMLAGRVVTTGLDIMFTSNDTPSEEFVLATKLGAIINLDDISHLKFLKESASLPSIIGFRYNPGRLGDGGNEIIGAPTEAKFGMTKDQILEAIKMSKKLGIKKFGLHTMVISNNLDQNKAQRTVDLITELAKIIFDQEGIKLDFIDIGGGIGIPYRPEDREFDIIAFGKSVKSIVETRLDYRPKLFMECGRYVTGPHGYLVSKVIHIKRTYKTFIGLDASMNNLMRPGMYGAYHHITVLGKNTTNTQRYDVTGALCENNDKFAIDRDLPEVKIGDYLVIHDVGAHGHAMGFNYNGKLRSAELLLHTDHSVELIRRAETPEDYFATLNIT